MSEWTGNERHQGRISAGGVEKDVDFVDSDHGSTTRSTTPTGSKYSHFRTGLDRIIGAGARSTTIRLVPRD